MMKFLLIVFCLFISTTIYAQPNFSNPQMMPTWGYLDPKIKCINYQWENSDLGSFSNWYLNGSNVNWEFTIQDFNIKCGFLYNQVTNIPWFAPANNYHLVFNYYTNGMGSN